MFMTCFLMGCCDTKYIYKTNVEYVVVKPSAALLEECKEITKKELKTNGDLLLAYNDLLFEYLICFNKVKTLKQFYINYDLETGYIKNNDEK